jgi:nitrogen fixation protein FixH
MSEKKTQNPQGKKEIDAGWVLLIFGVLFFGVILLGVLMR